MSIESGRYVRIEDNGQQNDSGGVGRTRIQDKIRQPSCFLAHGEQVSCWAFFFSHAPIFAHGCISILHRCITKPDNAPILHPCTYGCTHFAPTLLKCTHGRTHDAPICTHGCTHGTHRMNSYALRNEKYVGDVRVAKPQGQRKGKNEISGGYLATDNQPAIIPREIFTAVQEEKRRRSNIVVDETGRHRKKSRYSSSKEIE